MRNSLFLGVAVAALVIPAAAQAQETTSSIRGTVMGDNGAPVPGATVTITHVPTNTVQTVTAGNDGTFVANGLRVGGPFSVSVSAPGFEDTQVTDVTTQIGVPYNLPVTLNSTGDTIVVSASKIRGAGPQISAANTTLTAAQISTVATVNRDVRDLARRSPLVDIDLANNRALSFAGKNPRFNAYLIDGVRINDNYGLNADGLPTKRGPVPLEAIEQFSVMAAPYDVSYGLFGGGVINSVLKSGSNKFHGNFFYTYTGDGLTGSKVRDKKVDLKFNNYDWGGEVDGPIIKDRLFFTAAYEHVSEGKPFSAGPADAGFGDVIPNLTSDQINQVTQIANNVYSYDPGGIMTSEPQTSEFVTGKLDANITDHQHLSLTWINAYDTTPVEYNTYDSKNRPGIGLRSDGYSSAERLHAGILRWNSQWSDSFSTEARIIYKNYKQPSTPLMGYGFGMFQVCTDPTDTNAKPTVCNSSSPTITFGPDRYRHANLVENEEKGAYLQAEYAAGNHDVKLTAEGYEHWVYNLFGRDTLGVWGFDSIDAFQNKQADYFSYYNATTNNPQDEAVNYHYMTYAFGAQDHWQMLPNLDVLYGARVDLWGGHDRPDFNPSFLAREGFSNTSTYDGLLVFQPRISLNWRPTSRIGVKAGFGKFASGNPDIYLANSFGNAGINNRSVTFYAGDKNVPIAIQNAALNNVTGQVPQAVKDYLATLPASGSSIDALDPNFKIPSEWRGTASVDYRANLGPAGDGWDFGADFFYTKTIHGLGFYDGRSVRSGLLTPDGRPRYMPIDASTGTYQDIILTNFDRGRSYIWDVRFDKSWDWGLSLGGSYTWEDVKDNAPVTSSQASSLYSNAVFADPNFSAYGTSNDQVKWSFKWHIDFAHAFFGDYKTKFSLFGSTQAGRPFSYTMSETASGRSPSMGTVSNTSRYLLYVPTGVNDPNVIYGDSGLAQQLDSYISNSVLKNYRGQIAPRNIDRSKVKTRLDIHVEQEIPTFVGHSRISVFADVENFLNLLNKDWGIQEEVGFPYAASLVEFQCVTAAGTPSTVNTPCAKYKYTGGSGSNLATPNQTLTTPTQNSLYLVRVGVRLKF
ncbi:MAG: TonB-dependent receptor [Sphingomonas sp.]